MTALAKELAKHHAYLHWSETRKSWFLSFTEGKKIRFSPEIHAVSKREAQKEALFYLRWRRK